uniref:J domain-containing protein n=1 Tax=Plectus sambesii TaxID=2011161 RepID=A0A914W1C7_9BILA
MLKVYEHLKTQVNNSGYLLDIDALTVGGSIGFAHVWVLVTPEIQSKILIVLPQIIKRFAVSNASNAVQVDNSFGHGVAMAIVAVYLTYKAMYNIRRWWKDNISGKRVAKNIIDSCTTLVAGYGGSTAGATAGSFFGPTGTLIGSVIGGLAGSSGGGLLINMLTQELFDIPKDEALENAYNFLGVSRHATNNEINKAYRSLSLKYHPDKAGSQQEFVKLQACMEIIKVARGEEH